MADHDTDVYNRFYRCLLVQHILQHIRRHALSTASIGPIQRDIKGPNLKRKKQPWHVYLDSLSILCDHKTGGETVTAIAAERDPQREGNTIFWLRVNVQRPASNVHRASSHLIALIGRLQSIAQSGKANKNLMLESFYESAYHGRNRVNNYRKNLQGRTAALRDRDGGLSPDEDRLVEAVDALIDENITVGTLCEKAYEFRSTEHAQKLASIARFDRTGQWKLVSHFIGRLGAWLKATRFLFEHAIYFSEVLSNCEVKIVPVEDDPTFKDPPPMRELEQLLLQTLPPQFDVSKTRLEHLFGQGAVAVGEALLKKCEANGWRLKTHAEASMAHFFLSEDRYFVNGDRYIGCSKPSCMCCDLYLEALSGDFVKRPCHGNAWIQWRLPRPSFSTSRAETAIMQRMAARLQRDIEIEIVSASKGHIHTHDSSTDMSSVFGRLPPLHR